MENDSKECPICGYCSDIFSTKEIEKETEEILESCLKIDDDRDDEYNDEIADDYTCTNCNCRIEKDSLVCPNCLSVFIDSPIFVNAKNNGFILKSKLENILEDLNIESDDYDSIIEVFEEENIDVTDTEINEKMYECNNCGYKVSESDVFCPNCGLYFDDESSVDFISEMKEYLVENYKSYYVQEDAGFVGVKNSKISRFYFLYLTDKDEILTLFYRVNIKSADKNSIDITNKSIEDIKDIIDIIMSFHNDKLLLYYIDATYNKNK